MKADKKDYLLYAVTDRSWLRGETLYEQVEKALKGGVTFLQLREKNLKHASFLQEALEIKRLCADYEVPFIINDNVDVALACNADGVHVGQNDMEAGDVRKKLGPDKILGVSAHSVEDALLAESRGADYLGVGAAFQTGSKSDVNVIDHKIYKEICQAVNIPVVAIGGINKENILQLSKKGLSGVAVISAIFASPDIEEAARELRSLAEKVTAL